MAAQDRPQTEIAAAVGMHQSTISRTLQKDELNHLIRKAQTDLIKESLSIAIQNQADKIKASGEITHKIRSGEELTTGAVKLLELGHDAEKQVLQSVGIHNAHTQSITLNSIMIDARTELSPTIERMLTAHLSGDIIEAEVVDK